MNKITDQDLANRGINGMPDVPGLTTEEMQRKLEEIAREILIPKVNEIIENFDTLNSNLSFVPTKIGRIENTEIPTGINGKSINILFDSPLKSVPVIICSLSQFGAYMSYGVYNVSQNGFSIAIINNYSSALNITIDWVAIGGL